MPRAVVVILALMIPATAFAAGPCGYSPDDWCTSAEDGPCGAHTSAGDCRADPACRGMRYTGESVITCHWDENGYADNCPTVGCLPRK